MGWEMRGRKRYYYRKAKYTDENGRSRVRSIYCRSGERGVAAAREDEERRCVAAPAEGEPSVMPAVDRRAEPCATGGTRHVGARELAEAFALSLVIDTSTRVGDEQASAPGDAPLPRYYGVRDGQRRYSSPSRRYRPSRSPVRPRRYHRS